MSIFRVACYSYLQFRCCTLQCLDFVVANEHEAFASIFGKIDDSFVARKVLGEFAVAARRLSAAFFLLFFCGVIDDLLSIADRFFQSATDFRRGRVAEVQKQLTLAINPAFALAAVELLEQFFDRQIQLSDLLVQLVCVGF